MLVKINLRQEQWLTGRVGKPPLIYSLQSLTYVCVLSVSVGVVLLDSMLSVSVAEGAIVVDLLSC